LMENTFGPQERLACEALIASALSEDLQGGCDLTSVALVPETQSGIVQIVARQQGVVAGLPIVQQVMSHIDRSVTTDLLCRDGEVVSVGRVLANLQGPVRSLLTGERTVLNFLTALGGVATLTRQFVDQVAGTRARVLDTRKTWPGWRILQKYAVRCGGGTNHRMGLYDGILIKDNHLAAWRTQSPDGSVAAAIRECRKQWPDKPVEVEVDTLAQLRDALHELPEIVLLDNMKPAMLREAVEIRDKAAPQVQLEASGGVNLATIRDIAVAGVDRISIGALTHSAPALDIAFDWGR
jgi:nicotinate-nucleotide pyrophosphorylase (carboxylating)